MKKERSIIVKKVGILGGTFNPIHMGHLIMAELALEQFQLEKVIFMPSKNPPHKQGAFIASDEHRKQMIELSIKGNKKFELSTLELEREGITYTVDTLNYLVNNFPEEEYYFIIGADSLFQLETWKEPKKILGLANIVAATRYHIAVEVMKEQVRYLENTYTGKIEILDIPTIELSSKSIRERIESGKTIRYFTPEKVHEYILANKLYQKD